MASKRPSYQQFGNDIDIVNTQPLSSNYQRSPRAYGATDNGQGPVRDNFPVDLSDKCSDKNKNLDDQEGSLQENLTNTEHDQLVLRHNLINFEPEENNGIHRMGHPSVDSHPSNEMNNNSTTGRHEGIV